MATLSGFILFLRKISKFFNCELKDSKKTYLYSPMPEDFDWYEDISQRW